MVTRRLFAAALVWFCTVCPAMAQDDGLIPFLRFDDRADHVEVEKTRGALDLDKSFTIELWARWNTDLLDKQQYLAGDEAWPGMSPNVAVSGESGWVIRTSVVKDADKQAIEFNVAASTRGKRGWLSVNTTHLRVVPRKWQHIAVSRTRSEIQVYWNGRLAARRPVAGISLHSAPSNIFLGVRKDAWHDREFVGDIRAFRVSSKTRYTTPFKPEERLGKDADTVVSLDVTAADEGRVPDASGNKRDGVIVGAKLTKSDR